MEKGMKKGGSATSAYSPDYARFECWATDTARSPGDVCHPAAVVAVVKALLGNCNVNGFLEFYLLFHSKTIYKKSYNLKEESLLAFVEFGQP
jgi:hypothetical protein